jgi:4-amino-4-deoxy-L-arabinose transferase-like glycosyltransferase
MLAMLVVFGLARPLVMGGRVERRVCDVLVILGLLVWAGVNMNFNAQHVITDRDPATYAVAGQWLVNHDSLKIPLPDEFAGVPGVVSNSLGFSINNAPGNTYIYAQGQHLLPALLGLAGRSLGTENMLKINVIFGAIALLAVYGFARLLGRPRWAVVVTAALAASMPFIYFSRDTYTEPLAAMFTFGGLSLLAAAMIQKRWQLWFLAGFVIGAGALTRIDAYLTFIGVAAFMVIYLALTRKKERLVGLWQLLALAIGLLVTGGLGLLDVVKLAHPYFLDLHKEFLAQIAALVFVIIVGAVFVWLAWRTPLLKRLDKRTRAYRGSAIGLITVGFILFLACRPFIVWYTDRLDLASTVPSAHSNAEITTYWVAWYLGPILALLGLGGFTLAAARTAIRRYNLIFLPAILVLAVTCAVYLIKPSITPDQIWASRRLLPVILPGVAVFAVMALDWISFEFFEQWQFGEYFAGLTATALVVGSLFVSSPLVLLRDTAQLGTVQTACQILPKDSAVLLVGMAGQKMVQPLHAFCGTPAAAYVDGVGGVPSAETLRQVAMQASKSGKEPIVGLFGSDMALAPAGQPANFSTAAGISYRQLEHTFLSPPQHVLTEQDSLLFGRLQPDGSIVPLQ